MKYKRVISALLIAIMICTLGIPCFAADGQPFKTGNAGVERFRIPALITLKSGKLLAAADARYGHGTDSPANIDTVVSYSDDNGQSWSKLKKVNNFTDVDKENREYVVEASASFIDVALQQDSSGKVYLITDACPAFMGSPNAKKSGSGLIDGKIAVCDKTTTDKMESTALDKEHYPYYVGTFNNGYAPIKKFDDGKVYKKYYVDTEYKLYTLNGDEYKKVYVPVIGADGNLTEKKTQANLFYAHSPVKIYPAFYIWLRTSTDEGKTWSKPKILNKDIKSEGFTGICPGKGFLYNADGTERVIFTVYDNNKGQEYTSTIYTENGGKTWSRGERATKVGFSGKSSESQIVELYDGILRMYSRNTAGHISYTDSTDGGKTWGKYKLDMSLKYTSNCMVSFINYSGEIDGHKAIIAAYPSAKKRKLGTVKIGLVSENNRIDWKYSYNVTDDLNDLTYVYSCLSELPDGRIGLLYESQAAEISYKSYDVEELMRHEKHPNAIEKVFYVIISWFSKV